MIHVTHLATTRTALLLLVLASSACASRRRVAQRPQDSPEGRRGPNLLSDTRRLYQRMGLMASAGPIPFLGAIGYFGGPSPDSTVVLVTISLQNRSLTFKRDGDRYRALYQVNLDLRRGGTQVRHVDAHEIVRVQSLRETARTDESIIFQQFLRVSPGDYEMTVSVRDEEGARTAGEEAKLTVPRLAAGTLAKPLPVYEASPRASVDSLPRLAPSPRSTATFGRDSVLVIYLEGYGAGTGLPIAVAARNDKGVTLWHDTVTLSGRGTLFSGSLVVPVPDIGIGVTTLTLLRPDTRDSVMVPLFVNFGEDLPVATFDEMLDYLRYFAPTARLNALRDTTPEARPAAWLAFLKETDPVLGTPQHEGLMQYFARLQLANERFREEGQGWMSDRGKVFITLGDPDQVYEQGVSETTNLRKTQIWEYRQYRLQLVFQDQSGFGRWKLTTRSEADFQFTLRQVQQRR